ncbi:hypothetical protein GCK72_007953 [Caenorhabditis remanei]|uniref:F-box domain-containing protein n=1 Tax=Caenorhabditis remanei TaxID=31234 RepID=A0A6A5HQA5_CAERE|nr:hypothetical protein GCK72_007953 [Caenorhabditis remanei]KAF1767992.1 hypothetical protein GCK72_007953 [Caenorhabditis remanei]
MSPSLPFLRLPYLPMKHLLDHMDFMDIVNLSVCSEKTRVVILSIKRFPSTKDLIDENNKMKVNFIDYLFHLRLELPTSVFLEQVTFDIEPDCKMATIQLKLKNRKITIYIFTKSTKPSFRDKPDEMTINQKKFEAYRGNEGFMHLISDTTVEDGLITLINYFKRTFGVGVNRLSIYLTQKNFVVVKSVINYLNSTCTSIKDLDFQSVSAEDYYLKSILSNIDAWDTFHIDIKTSFQFECLRYFKSENFELKSGGWFTFYNLQLVDCAFIKIMGSQLTNCNMKEYLMQWIDGNFDELRHLDVEMREVRDEEYLLDGMSPGSFTREENCIAFKRSDGKTAIIELSPEVKTNWFKITVY